MNWKRVASIATTVLTISGIAGTGYLTAKATVKAVHKADEMKGQPKKEIAKAVWKYYIPPAAAALGTASCVVGTHIWNQREQTALAAGQVAIAQSFGQYRRKLTEMYGEDIGKSVDQAILVEKAENADLYAQGAMTESCCLRVPTEEQEMIFEEYMSGRRFKSTLSRVVEAEYHLNRNFVLAGSATYSQYLEFLGLQPEKVDSDYGWTIDDEFYWIDFNHEMFKSTNGETICAITPIFRAEKFELF